MAERMLSKEAQATLEPCPKCRLVDMIEARSYQAGEDHCGVYVACKRCDYDPTGNSGDHVETVWGMEDWAVRAAMETWNEFLSDGEAEAV